MRGQIVEEASTRAVPRPRHPYTQGLIGSVPVIGQRRDRLDVIPGRVPNLIDLPVGCRFAPRCRAREEHGLTRTEAMPALVEVVPGHSVRCFLHSDAEEAPADVAVEWGAGDRGRGVKTRPGGRAHARCRREGWSRSSTCGAGCSAAPSARCGR